MKNPVLRGGLVLGLGCTAWTFLMGFTGWYKHPSLLHLFWMVVLIEFVVLGWTLSATRRLGGGYGAQVRRGVTTAAIAAPIIFAQSLLFTTVVFPQYFAELRAFHEKTLREQGLPEEQVRAAVEAAAASQSAVMNAVSGAVGTVITGLVASLILAIFLRPRAQAPAAATIEG